jgi:hypothetical protein
VTIEELALKIAKQQGSDALDDWMGLGEMLDEYELGDYEHESLAELVRAIHDEAWQLYADHHARLAAGTRASRCDGHCSGNWIDPHCSWHGTPACLAAGTEEG